MTLKFGTATMGTPGNPPAGDNLVQIAGSAANAAAFGSAMAALSNTNNDGFDPGQNGQRPVVMAYQLFWNPVLAVFERARTGSIYKAVAATAAGATALWTPAAGKKFRLLGYLIEVPGDATLAAPGEQVIQLLDAAGAIAIVHRFYLTAAAAGVNYTTGGVKLGPNGYLSALANNVLNVSLGTVLAAGNILVLAWGTEE